MYLVDQRFCMNFSQQLSSLTLASHPAFEFVRKHTIKSTEIIVYQYRHKITGAIHYITI